MSKIKQKVLLSKSIDLLLSSDPATGAKNISSKGDSFTVDFTPSFGLPEDSVNPRLSCEAASLWFVNPNLSAELKNNTLTVSKTSVSSDQIITIPDGLFSLSQLSQTCARLTSSLGHHVNGVPPFEFAPCSGTNKVELILNALDVSVEFTATSPYTLLGFGIEKIGFPTYQYEIFLSGNEAQMNNINSYHLHTSLVRNGIAVGNSFTQCIAAIPINSPAGSQIMFDPLHSSKIEVNELVGAKISQIRCWMTDERNQSVDMRNETFDFRVKIAYEQPYEF